MKNIDVVKESGEVEKFERGKVLKSLLNSGVRPEHAQMVVDRIKPSLAPFTTSKDIFRLARKELLRCDSVARMRYGLKKAIFALGPSGYPFERFVARVMDAHGYTTEVDSFVEGYCVTHEVDVVAKKDSEIYMVECKFHINGGVHSDVKTALYVSARFRDIDKARRKKDAHKADGKAVLKGMLVTNTRFSSEAIKYGKCSGLKLVGWKYPRNESLESLIDSARTYPVTVLPAVSKKNLKALINREIVLVTDLGFMDPAKLAKMTGIDRDTAKRLVSQASGICG